MPRPYKGDKGIDEVLNARFRGAVFLDAIALSTPPAGASTLGVSASGAFCAIDDAAYPLPLVSRSRTLVPSIMLDEVDNTSAWLEGVRVPGTVAVPTKVLATHRLLRIGAGGRHGGSATAFSKATVDFEASGDWDSSTDTPSQVVVKATPDGSGTPAAVLTARGDGAVFAGDTSTGKRLDRSGVLYHSETLTTTPSSAADQALMSQSIAANTLAVNGDRLSVHLEGDFLTNSGTPTFTPKVKWGALTLAPSAGVAETASANARQVVIDLEIVRLTATTQAVRGLWVHSNKSAAEMAAQGTSQTWVIASNTAAETLSGAVTLSIVSNFTVANAANRMRSFSWSVQRLSAS